jgi:hypothetical protein
MHVTRLFCPPLKWEKGGGGMRGKGARECRTSLISPKNSTLERKGVGGDEGQKRTGMQQTAHLSQELYT